MQPIDGSKVGESERHELTGSTPRTRARSQGKAPVFRNPEHSKIISATFQDPPPSLRSIFTVTDEEKVPEEEVFTNRRGSKGSTRNFTSSDPTLKTASISTTTTTTSSSAVTTMSSSSSSALTPHPKKTIKLMVPTSSTEVNEKNFKSSHIGAKTLGSNLKRSPRTLLLHDYSPRKKRTPCTPECLPVSLESSHSSEHSNGSSPRNKSRSTEHSPREKIDGFKGFDWESPVKEDTPLKAKIDNELFKLRDNGFESQNPANHITDYLNQRIYFCFHDQQMTLEEFDANEAELIHALLFELNNPKIILKSALPRLKKIEEMIHGHSRMFPTKWNEEVYRILCQFQNAESIGAIFEILKEVDSHSLTDFLHFSSKPRPYWKPDGMNLSSSIKDILCACIGRSVLETNTVIELLNKWRLGSSGKNEKEIKLHIDESKKVIENLCNKEKKIKSYIFKFTKNFLAKITPKSIQRSFIQNETVLFNEFSIFNIDKTKVSVDVSMDEKELFSDLIKKNYRQGLWPEISDEEIKSQVVLFFKELNREEPIVAKKEKDLLRLRKLEIVDLNPKKVFGNELFEHMLPPDTFTTIQELKSQIQKLEQVIDLKVAEASEREYKHQCELEKKIPCLIALKLATIDCLLLAWDEFLRKVDTSIFHLKFVQGMVGNESIKSKDRFSVEQKRKIEICLLEDSSLVASLEASWRVYPKGDKIKGKLVLSALTMHNATYFGRVMQIFEPNP